VLKELGSINRNKLFKLSLGDSKQKVLQIMGTETIESISWEGEDAPSWYHINSPYKTEMINEDGKTYEIIFYFTDENKGDGVITEDELTPIVFLEGKVIGFGWLFAKDTIPKYNEEINKFELEIRD